MQSLKLLPRELDAATLARFLRACPGLAKPAIGEILGERDAFYEDVRAAYMQTFDFTGGRRCGHGLAAGLIAGEGRGAIEDGHVHAAVMQP